MDEGWRKKKNGWRPSSLQLYQENVDLTMITSYYPLVNIQKNYGKSPFILDFAIENGDFP